MKKIFVILVFCLVSICSFGKVIYHKEGPSLVIEFHRNSCDSITIDNIKEDFYTAINLGKKMHCKNVLFKDCENHFYELVVGKKEINNPDKHFNNVLDYINNLTEHEYIKGDVIREYTAMVSGPKYVSITKINGRTESVYESDWNSGYFPTERSSYSAAGMTATTETKYVPAKYEKRVEYGPGKTITTPGIEIFIEKTYFIDN